MMTVPLNCSVETNLIDSNTVSIKYIVGGWLTLIFCIFGKQKIFFFNQNLFLYLKVLLPISLLLLF
jgi:hypothetical protein